MFCLCIRNLHCSFLCFDWCIVVMSETPLALKTWITLQASVWSMAERLNPSAPRWGRSRILRRSFGLLCPAHKVQVMSHKNTNTSMQHYPGDQPCFCAAQAKNEHYAKWNFLDWHFWNPQWSGLKFDQQLETFHETTQNQHIYLLESSSVRF